MELKPRGEAKRKVLETQRKLHQWSEEGIPLTRWNGIFTPKVKTKTVEVFEESPIQGNLYVGFGEQRAETDPLGGHRADPLTLRARPPDPPDVILLRK